MDAAQVEKARADAELLDASRGFEAIFNDDIGRAVDTFKSSQSPFHQMGLGVAYFLQAALGMETELMDKAAEHLTNAEAKASQQVKIAKASASPIRRPGTLREGIEWEVLRADAVVLLGLTNALQESYLGFAKCFFALNSAHSKFTALYKEVYPHGLTGYKTPAMSRAPSPAPSIVSAERRVNTAPPEPASRAQSIKLTNTAISENSMVPSPISSIASNSSGKSFGSKLWGMVSAKPVTTPSVVESSPDGEKLTVDGAMGSVFVPTTASEALVMSGTAFGYGLFNLILSLLPPKVRNVISVFGFKNDRRLALQALAVAAEGSDVHSEFAALTLMTYSGIVLLVAGFQADEPQMLKQYDAMLTKVEKKYPHGSLWVLNRAKLQRYSGHNDEAIRILNEGLSPDRPLHFKQADAMLVFEVAWIYLAERRFEESAEMFLKMQTLNNWSHPTYSYIAAGCYLSLNTPEGKAKAREQLDRLPVLLERKKIGGRDLPTEVLIRKKLAQYRKKQVARGGKPDEYIDIIRISPAEELGCVWNNHGKITKEIAVAHINELMPLIPVPTISSPYASASSKPSSPKSLPDLDTPDEFTSRDLLLGILHRGAGCMSESRAFLESATKRPGVEGVWMINTAYFELAVLALKLASDADAEDARNARTDRAASQARWNAAFEEAERYLASAANGTANIDLGSRLESRIAFIRDEIAQKRQKLNERDPRD